MVLLILRFSVQIADDFQHPVNHVGHGDASVFAAVFQEQEIVLKPAKRFEHHASDVLLLILAHAFHSFLDQLRRVGFAGTSLLYYRFSSVSIELLQLS